VAPQPEPLLGTGTCHHHSQLLRQRRPSVQVDAYLIETARTDSLWWIIDSEVVEMLKDVRKSIIQMSKSIDMRLGMLTNNTTVLDLILTPSEACKSDKKDQFLALMDVIGLEHTVDLKHLAVDKEHTPTDIPKFQFAWEGDESSSYAELDKYLRNLGLASVIANGLSDGLYSQNLFVLQNNTFSKKSLPLRFKLRGTTDIVVLDSSDPVLNRRCAKFAIEIKTVEDMEDDNLCLREAFLQLVGLNADNSRSSPPVILTNLDRKHYVLFFESKTVGNHVKYDLRIFRFKTFEQALGFVRTALFDRKSVTSDLCGVRVRLARRDENNVK
jgi:hypothetical protein